MVKLMCKTANLVTYRVSAVQGNDDNDDIEYPIYAKSGFYFCKIKTIKIRYFLAIFRNEMTTILTPATSEGGEWGRWGWSRFSF